jgi:hypothetical protein
MKNTKRLEIEYKSLDKSRRVNLPGFTPVNKWRPWWDDVEGRKVFQMRKTLFH